EVDFNQFEAGALATSPMATAGAARNLDQLRYAGAGNVNGFTGAFYSEVVIPTVSGIQVFSDVNNVLTTQIPVKIQSGTLQLTDGTANRDSGLAFTGANSVQKAASSWGGANCAFALNATNASGVAFDGDMNVGPNIQIGNNINGTQPLNGMMKNVRFY